MADDDLLASAAQLESATKGRIKATDPFVTEALAAATEAVRSVCGWHVGPVKSETQTLDGSGSRIQKVKSLRVQSITSVVDNGVTLVEGVDFDWSENGVMERCYWSRKRRGVVVVLTHGYDPSEIRGVVNLVVAIAARTLVARRSMGAVREQAGTSSVEFGKIGGFVSMPADATVFDHEMAVLRGYIIPESA